MPTIHSRGVGQLGFRKQSRALFTLRMKAITVPSCRCAVGAGVSSLVSAGDGEPGAIAAGDGAGVTTGVTSRNPEPAARAPPTTIRAATARSVKRRRPDSGRRGAGIVTGIVATLSRRPTGAASVDADLGLVPGPEPPFQLSIGHRTIPLVSAVSIASCSRFSA